MLKSEDPGSAACPGVCTTCLATDRDLFSLHKTPQFVNICIGLALSKDDVVCYECRARLTNFVKFRSRALRAKRMLSRVSPSRRVQQSVLLGVRCLSTLSRTVLAPNNTIYLNSDLVQVKLEISDSASQVKEEESEQAMRTVGPLGEPGLRDSRFKPEGNNPDEVLTSDPKSELEDNDDVKSVSASEDGTGKPQKEQIDFIVKQIEHSKVLAYLEEERSSERYQRATYKCEKCALPFFSEQTMQIHNTLHNDNRRHFKCEVCEQRFKSKPQLKRHSDCHYRHYGCPECQRTDSSYSKMYEHYKSVHGGPNTPQLFRKINEQARSAQRRVRRFPCGSCAREYATSYGLQQHHKRVHDTTVPELECDVCHKKYKGEFNLRVHVRNVHESKPGDAYCVECNMQFKHPHQYKQHLNTSKHVPAENYKYECDYCGKKFPQKQTLTDHVEEQHLKLANYTCDLCEDRFHSKRYAVRHKRRRHGNKRERSSCIQTAGNPSAGPEWPSGQLWQRSW